MDSTRENPVKGRKDDAGKIDLTLLEDMPRALCAVAGVMEWAVKDKPNPYVRGSWLGVAPERYKAAQLRHRLAAAAEAPYPFNPLLAVDRESGLLHLAHEACSLLMALENTLRAIDAKDKE